MVINTETQSAETKTVESSTLNGTSILHLLLSRLRDHCRRGCGKSVTARGSDGYKETVSGTQLDSCTCELTAYDSRHKSPASSSETKSSQAEMGMEFYP